ncbi:threonine-phosphate decarboxylase CobD [Pseudoxanthomonas beigongshangi]
MLEHGGRLLRAARRHGIPVDEWLDLSTGVSPFPWPVPTLPASVWQRLPEEDDGLLEIARRYYRAPTLLPVAGSQAAIQALPHLRPLSRVGIIAPGYAEHAHAWRQAGHDVVTMPADALLAAADRFDVIVLIHPNNPGGERFRPERLLALHAGLASRGGWLVVDEAFIDVEPDASLCGESGREGLVVLRSVGKFFGMAGARAGFVCAASPLMERMRERLGPWTLSGPSRYALRLALSDDAWQAQARARLLTAGERLAETLRAAGLAPAGGCALFQWCRHPRARELHEALARRAILTRLFEEPASLRFGLPPGAAGLDRLREALVAIDTGATA